MSKKSVIAWWSAGITSAVACRLALEKYENVKLVYIHIGSHHKDSLRFKEDCEKWYGREIEIWQNKKYKDHIHVVRKERYVNGPGGAKCTSVLKKDVRAEVESSTDFYNQVFGFEFTPKEVNRAIRWQEQWPHTKPLFPLIENKLDKNQCAGIIESAGIKIPEMYRLGYNNNNCIGCVKGGQGYWNKIRVDFPEVFKAMAEAEREIGATCLKTKTEKKLYLDKLNPKAGRKDDIVLPECGIFCQVDFAHLMSAKVIDIMEGKISIYQVA